MFTTVTPFAQELIIVSSADSPSKEAPYPLSIFTTVTPFAQELIIVSSADSP